MMNTSIDPQLPFELQELYLRNKQWLSDVKFLESESILFQKLFNKILSSTITKGCFEKITTTDFSLDQLQEQRNKLRELVSNYQHTLEALIADQNKKVGRELTFENEAVNNEIKALIIIDKLVKTKLCALVEAIIGNNKAALTNNG